jgi:hypothetical protein
MKEKKRELIHLEMCVGFVDHLDNCESFGVFDIFKNMSKNNCLFLIC